MSRAITKRKPCPECKKGTKDRALAITANDRGIMWYCHRCLWNGSHTWDYLLRRSRDSDDIAFTLNITVDVRGRCIE